MSHANFITSGDQTWSRRIANTAFNEGSPARPFAGLGRKLILHLRLVSAGPVMPIHDHWPLVLATAHRAPLPELAVWGLAILAPVIQ